MISESLVDSKFFDYCCLYKCIFGLQFADLCYLVLIFMSEENGTSFVQYSSNLYASLSKCRITKVKFCGPWVAETFPKSLMSASYTLSRGAFKKGLDHFLSHFSERKGKKILGIEVN